MLYQSNARKSFDPFTVSRLPARLDADNVARILGFSAHDIPILVSARLLRPLGKPSQNAVKYFAAAVVEQLHSDQNWLDAATKILSQHWVSKNARKKQPTAPAPVAT